MAACGEPWLQAASPDEVGGGDHVAVLALAEGRGGVALHTIERGGTWGRAETRPWEHDEIPRDVAVVESRIAITVQRDLRSTLYLLERANLVYRRTIAVPCVEPQIVGHRNDTLWVTGMSPPPGPRRATCSVSTCGPE